MIRVIKWDPPWQFDGDNGFEATRYESVSTKLDMDLFTFEGGSRPFDKSSLIAWNSERKFVAFARITGGRALWECLVTSPGHVVVSWKRNRDTNRGRGTHRLDKRRREQRHPWCSADVETYQLLWQFVPRNFIDTTFLLKMAHETRPIDRSESSFLRENWNFFHKQTRNTRQPYDFQYSLFAFVFPSIPFLTSPSAVVS